MSRVASHQYTIWESLTGPPDKRPTLRAASNSKTSMPSAGTIFGDRMRSHDLRHLPIFSSAVLRDCAGAAKTE